MADYFTNDNQYDSSDTLIDSSNSNYMDEATLAACIKAIKTTNGLNPDQNQRFTTDSANNRSGSKSKYDYRSGSQDFQNSMEELEKILDYYRQDLKNDKITQIDCCRQLVTRLADLIRPVYTSHDKKNKNLNDLIDKISILHDKRLVDEKEKTKQLREEILRLETFIVKSTNPNNSNRKLSQQNLTTDRQEWSQIEEDTKRLQTIIEYQRNQINELITILSQQANYSTNSPNTTTNQYSYNPSKPNVTDPPYVSPRSKPSDYEKKNSGSNDIEWVSPIKSNGLLQSIRICPLCQALFSIVSMSEEQFQEHVEAHIY